jgi:cytochrome c553
VKLKLIVTVAVTVFLFITCKHEIVSTGDNNNGTGNNNNNPPPVTSSTCSADTVYFANAILPLISSGCAMSGCHDATTHKQGLVLNSYSGIMKIVSAGNASGSKLYQVISTSNQGDIMPPPPHQPFSATDKAAIQKWINQGAKNNQCNSGCDTTLFTYSGAVTPLMNTYCKGCHNPASLGGSVDLSTYTGVKAAAASGRLLGSIQHATGYVAMPQGGNKLADCQIRQIEKWIQAGTPNN